MKTFIIAVFFLGLTGLIQADEIYTYTGDPLTNFSSIPFRNTPYSITGEFTVSGPLINVTNDIISPLSFDFVAGNIDLNNHDTFTVAPLFEVSTNNLGQITSWDIRLKGVVSNGSGVIGILDSDNAEDFVENTNSGAYAFNDPMPGGWNDPAAVPEPRLLWLLMAALGTFPLLRSAKARVFTRVPLT